MLPPVRFVARNLPAIKETAAWQDVAQKSPRLASKVFEEVANLLDEGVEDSDSE